jgi:hypothetical protein
MGGLFGGGGSTPAPPPVVRMPSENDQNLRRVYTDTLANGRKRSGRLSTILADTTARNVNGSVGAIGA